jgi:ATPase subunit of ABC transporter with duplicated ATPase domains
VVGFPGEPLFRADDIELRRLECAALIGPNGAGKTTFLKTILEKHPPLSGEVLLGASLQIGYFAQAHEDLIPARTLVQEIEAVAPGMLLAEIRITWPASCSPAKTSSARSRPFRGESAAAWPSPSSP